MVKSPGAAKLPGVVKELAGVEKNIPDPPVNSFIGLNPFILSFSGCPTEFGSGLPKLNPEKLSIEAWLFPVSPSSTSFERVAC